MTVSILLPIMNLFNFQKKSSEENDSPCIPNKEDTDELFRKLDCLDLEKYIFLKGKNLSSVESKLTEYGDLLEKGKEYKLQLKLALTDGWHLIKLPSYFRQLAVFHDMVSWFLGYPPKDTNYADVSIGLATDKNDLQSYMIYGDSTFYNIKKGDDSLYCVFKDNRKYSLRPPYNNFTPNDTDLIGNFYSQLKTLNLDLEIINSESLNFADFEILINDL